MRALMPRATHMQADHSARLHVLEAYIETLKAENQILKRRLSDAEARAARQTANANGAIAEFPPLTERSLRPLRGELTRKLWRASDSRL